MADITLPMRGATDWDVSLNAALKAISDEQETGRLSGDDLDARYVQTVNGTAPDLAGNVDVATGGGSGAVDSVNSKTGAVVLDASDVGARADDWMPTASDVGARSTSWKPASTDISDATTVGKALVTAASATAARTATGAAADSAVVKLTGAQTVAGVKTFSSSPIVPTPTTATQAATKAYVDSVASGGGTEVTSNSITDATTVGKAVLTASSQAAARTAIGAGTGNGTSNLDLGTTASTAKAGNWKPASTDITDATATGKAVLTASSQSVARAAIGAGTSDVTVGTSASNAKAGNWKPTIADLPAGSLLRVLYTGTVWPARPTTRTDVFVDWLDATGSAPTDTSPTGIVAGDTVTIVTSA